MRNIEIKITNFIKTHVAALISVVTLLGILKYRFDNLDNIGPEKWKDVALCVLGVFIYYLVLKFLEDRFESEPGLLTLIDLAIVCAILLLKPEIIGFDWLNINFFSLLIVVVVFSAIYLALFLLPTIIDFLHDHIIWILTMVTLCCIVKYRTFLFGFVQEHFLIIGLAIVVLCFGYKLQKNLFKRNSQNTDKW